MDKRGKPIKKSSIDHLRRYYDLESSDEDEDDSKKYISVDKDAVIKSKKNVKIPKAGYSIF